MNLPEDVLAARGYLDVARGDCERGFHLSACLTAQKAAEVALQAVLRARGMAGPETMPALLSAVAGGTPALERAAVSLERFRMDMHSPYRSAPDLDDSPTPESAAACCDAAASLVAHVEALLADPPANPPAAGPGGRPGRSAEADA